MQPIDQSNSFLKMSNAQMSDPSADAALRERVSPRGDSHLKLTMIIVQRGEK
jgi:hypothetical protein